MSSKSGSSALFGGIILLVLVAGFTAMSTFSGSQGGATPDIQPEGISSATSEPTPSESAGTPKDLLEVPPVLILSQDGTTSRIIQRKTGQADRVLFTDSDEAQKLQQVIGLGSNRVYALLGADPASSGRIASILLDGSGAIELLSEPIRSSSTPAVRPDGQRLALVTFDNAERSFGFTLKTQTLNNAGETVIDTHENGLALPRWSSDGTRLAFIKGQATPDAGQEIRVSINDAAATTHYTTTPNTTVTDLTWLGTNDLLLVLEPLGNETHNQAKLARLSLGTNTLNELIDAEGKERGLATAPDATVVGFISGQVPAGTTLPTGTVTIQSLTSSQSITVGQATSVLGWLQ